MPNNTDLVTYAVSDGIALITFNRPEVRNAWLNETTTLYRTLLCEAELDRQVRVVVVTGAGSTFCVGADMSLLDEMSGGTATIGPTNPDGTPMPLPGNQRDPDYALAHAYTLAMSKPVIAAINGAAAGIGFITACYADIRLAAAGAKLTTSVAKLGLPAEHGMSWLLPRLIGLGPAVELLLTGRTVTAEEAATMGLIHHVYPADQLHDQALSYAAGIVADVAPSSLKIIKAQIYADMRGSFADAVRVADESMQRTVPSYDFREAVTAFGERRHPNFSEPVPYPAK
jgi:enoyl-CoA hydratase/carnithine racemase